MPKDNFLLKTPQTIASADITVVIQGLLYRNHAEGDLALRALTSIRQHLPHAEILISTWPHQSVAGLTVDQVLVLEEPICFEDVNGEVNNVLRQIVSTRHGIEAAKRPYVLKFRADHFLLNSNITRLSDYSASVASHKQFFSHPVTVTNLFIRNPVHVPMLFHLSDLVQFGCKQDLLDLWSIRMPTYQDIYFPTVPKWRIGGHFGGYSAKRQVPEQTLMLAWLAKKGTSIQLPHPFYSSYSLLKLWEHMLVDHFYVMNWQHSGIVFPKRFHNIFYTQEANYTEQTLIDVKKHLNSRFYWLRYLCLLINKYITCWFNRAYLHSAASNILFSLSPALAEKMRVFYRKKIKRN